MLQPDTCSICYGLGWVSYNVPVGHRLFGRLVPCECKAAEISAILQAATRLRPNEQHITLDDVVQRGECSKRAVGWARTLVQRRHGFMTIWGGPGNGKTMVLQAVVNDCVKLGMTAVYVKFSPLVEIVQEGYKPGATESARTIADRYLRVGCLVIDEADKIGDSDWLHRFRHEFVDERYRDAVEGVGITMLAMNRPPDDVFSACPELVSRLGDGRFALERDDKGEPVPAIMENWEADIRQSLRVS